MELTVRIFTKAVNIHSLLCITLCRRKYLTQCQWANSSKSYVIYSHLDILDLEIVQDGEVGKRIKQVRYIDQTYQIHNPRQCAYKRCAASGTQILSPLKSMFLFLFYSYASPNPKCKTEDRDILQLQVRLLRNFVNVSQIPQSRANTSKMYDADTN